MSITIVIMYVTLFVLFVTFAVVFPNDVGDRCITPNGELATCVPINSCSRILESLLSLSVEAAEFALESQCTNTNTNETLICCGNATSLDSSIEFSVGKLIPNRSVCGLENNGNRIYGGEQATLEEFPWMALLGYIRNHSNEISFRCGGSVINNRYVLTAAHCIRVKPALGISLHLVRLGEWNLTSDEDCYMFDECTDPIIDLQIEKQIPHPLYSARTSENDIGLLRLKKNFKYSDYIQPICLPFNRGHRRFTNKRLVVSGWGATEKGATSDVKLKLEVPIISQDECQRKLGQRGKITQNQICAGGEEGKDACQGDSGGPLMSSWELTNMTYTQWYLEGIVSWGSKCGVIGMPGIYTRVSEYLIWILDNLEDF
ncbi:hypothetical protein RI129_000820 [Pyrocoelia pectoralis]|uniref:CLIP domain-containing serine protease n=1 Tax=Pyrocoelia pectoralis TaxID=417401 RepID=A0AAN7ZWH4_9COLE